MFSQTPSKLSTFITIRDTVWIYPPADVDYALAHTSYKYKKVDNRIICPDQTNFIGLYTDIFQRTEVTQPVGNTGYSLGVGTLLQDLGNTVQFELEDGRHLVTWRLTKQISPQTSPAVAVPGNSPPETIGYVTTFTAYGNGPNGAGSVSMYLDQMMVVRTG